MSQRKLQTYFFLALLLASAVLTVVLFQPYLVMLAFGGVFAIVSRPLYAWLFRHLKSPTAAAFLTIIVIAAAVVLPIVIFAAGLAVELSGLFADIRSHIASGTFERLLRSFVPEQYLTQVPALMEEGVGVLRSVAQGISTNLLAFFSNVFSIVFSFLIILISTYYLLKDGTQVKRKLLALSPLGDDQDEQVFRRVVTAVRAVITGTIVVGIVKGILAGLMFWALGVPAPLFWGALTGFSSFVPVVGSAIVTVPATLYLLAIGNYPAAIGLAVVSISIIGTIDNFLQPKLVESQTNIHPLLVLLSILGGLKLYGFAGFILGPLTLAVTLALVEIYEKDFRPDVRMPPAPDAGR